MPDEQYRLGTLKGRWVVTWHEEGTRRRARLFPDDQTRPRTRRQAADELIAWTRAQQATAAPTVGKLWEMYRKEKDGRRVAVAMGFEWRLMGAFWGHLAPSDITTEKCREWVAQRRAAGKNDGTIWTELGHLRTVMRWAWTSGLIDRAPRIERPSKPAPKERRLTRAELERLVGAAKAPHIQLAIILLIATGARKGAILDLTWDRVDFGQRIIKLRVDGTGPRKGRATVPINNWLMAALTQAKAESKGETDYVVEYCGQPVADIKTGFNAAVAAAGLADVTPHVIRHSVACLMAEDGIPMGEIATFLGHEDSRITERVYARFSPGHLRRAADVVDFSTIRRVK